MTLYWREMYILSRIKCSTRAPKGYFLTSVQLTIANHSYVYILKFCGSLQTCLNMSSIIKTKVSGLSEANASDLLQNSSLRLGVVLSARPNSNGPIRVEGETTFRAAVASSPYTSVWAKPKRQVLKQIFRSSRVFRPPRHTNLEWNLLGFMELLFLLRFGTFPVEEKAICGVTSGQRWMEWSAFSFF